MKKLDRALLTFIIIISIFNAVLVATGESRPDAYISVSILIYFVHTTLFPSIRKASNLTILDFVFVLVFITIVSYRVLSILEMT